MKDDFYLDLHSEASLASYSDNRPGSFRSKLTEPIQLEDGEWDVAIASISQYYETSLEDVHYIREKRQAAATPGVEIEKTYPEPDNKAKILAIYNNYLESSAKYYGFLDNIDAKCTVTLTVGGKKKEITYVANPLTTAALKNILKSEVFEGVKFEHSDVWGVGLLTVSCAKGDSTKDIAFSIEFSKDLKTLMILPQTIYTGTLNPASKTRVNITLRAKDKIPKWPDVRTTLPYIWTVSAEEP